MGDAAARIETSIFIRAYAGKRVTMVSSAHSSGIALIAVDRDDIVVGANRAARFELGLDQQSIQCPLTAADALQEDMEAVDKQLQDAERAALRRALSRNNNSVLLTAQSLGISRSTLHRKIKRLYQPSLIRTLLPIAVDQLR